MTTADQGIANGPPGPTVLLVEGDPAIADQIVRSLADDVPVSVVSRLDSGSVSTLTPALVLVGPSHSIVGAAGVCETARSAQPLVAVLCITGHNEVENRARLLQAGADDIIGWPLDPDELRQVVRALTRAAVDRALATAVVRRAQPAKNANREMATPPRANPNVQAPPVRRRRRGAVAGGIVIAGAALALALTLSVRWDPGGSGPVAQGTLATASPPPTMGGVLGSGGESPPAAIGTSSPLPTLESPTGSAAASASPSVATPTPQPTLPGISRLPSNPQPARFALTLLPPKCVGAPEGSPQSGTFSDSRGQLRLSFASHIAVGALDANGTFDLAGVDPFEHWHGRMDATGGSATYELVTDGGCTQSYGVTFTFTR